MTERTEPLSSCDLYKMSAKWPDRGYTAVQPETNLDISLR